ncbi:nitroreductase family protein [Streptomyces sp. M2CJ-2]|uniref:Acg family FMN-binding oxidoreductase n=1 Tax=Streptomyces sp. M2CJ-2 TaxID=2803948 RepID=UPI001928D16E|nr:nitroreductase family protein [Streptomyces sp. M2CJ-2]MBL3668879.1 nitroreductase family protein [Streptomyces sp. M2CJ-2]
MHNAQPWRFRYFRGSRTFQVRADLDRVLPHADPDNRALHLGDGAALLNLRVALTHEGWHPAVRLLPDPADPTLLAVVRLTAPGSGRSALSALYPAIHQRHSSRFPFEETEIPQELRTALADAARSEGATLTFPSSWHLQQVLELLEEAEARNLTDRGSGQDLAKWTRIDTPSGNAAPDGVPDYAFGPRKHGGKAPMRDFAGSRPVPGRGTAEFERTPQLAVLSTSHDRPEDWLRAGQAMERVLLLATLEGLSSSFATQALEWSDLRWPLRDPVSGAGHIQIVLRLGYGPKGPGAPRRPVPDVLDIQP